MRNLEWSGSYGWQKYVKFERVRGSFLKQSVVSAAELNTYAPSIIKQKNIKFFPFQMLGGGGGVGEGRNLKIPSGFLNMFPKEK